MLSIIPKIGGKVKLGLQFIFVMVVVVVVVVACSK